MFKRVIINHPELFSAGILFAGFVFLTNFATRKYISFFGQIDGSLGSFAVFIFWGAAIVLHGVSGLIFLLISHRYIRKYKNSDLFSYTLKSLLLFAVGTAVYLIIRWALHMSGILPAW